MAALIKKWDLGNELNYFRMNTVYEEIPTLASLVQYWSWMFVLSA